MSIEQENWLAKPLGQYLLEQEEKLFDNAVTNLFGFNAVQVGMLQVDLLKQCRIPFAFNTDIAAGNVRSDSSLLPFASNSLDLVLLPHTLDFSADPHQTLREAERVLVPEGHLIISGFNPLSNWGLKRVLVRRRGFPWSGHFLTPLRTRDWLALLGFEIVEANMTCHVPPFNNAKWLDRCRFLDKPSRGWWPVMGGVYFLVAKKRVLGMRVIKPSWSHSRLRPRLAIVPSRKAAKTIQENKLENGRK